MCSTSNAILPIPESSVEVMALTGVPTVIALALRMSSLGHGG
jgi:hypothetical protein